MCAQSLNTGSFRCLQSSAGEGRDPNAIAFHKLSKHCFIEQMLFIFLHGPSVNLNVSLMLACLGTSDLITVLFFRCPGKLFTMKMKMQYLPYRQ